MTCERWMFSGERRTNWRRRGRVILFLSSSIIQRHRALRSTRRFGISFARMYRRSTRSQIRSLSTCCFIGTERRSVQPVSRWANGCWQGARLICFLASESVVMIGQGWRSSCNKITKITIGAAGGRVYSEETRFFLASRHGADQLAVPGRM